MGRLPNLLLLNVPMDISSTKAVVKSASQLVLSAQASGSTTTFANPVETGSSSTRRAMGACLASKGNSTVKKLTIVGKYIGMERVTGSGMG